MLWCCMATHALHLLVLSPTDTPGPRMGPLPPATGVHIKEIVGVHLGLDGQIPPNQNWIRTPSRWSLVLKPLTRDFFATPNNPLTSKGCTPIVTPWGGMVRYMERPKKRGM